MIVAADESAQQETRCKTRLDGVAAIVSVLSANLHEKHKC